MEHVSHFNQKMTIHSRNKALICKVFPSSLGPMTKRWFDGLEKESIRLYEELPRAVQIDPATQPTRRTDLIRPYFSGRSATGLHHQKPISAGWFRFSPKTQKTRTDRKISRFRQNFQNPTIIFQNPTKKPRIRQYFP